MNGTKIRLVAYIVNEGIIDLNGTRLLKFPLQVRVDSDMERIRGKDIEELDNLSRKAKNRTGLY